MNWDSQQVRQFRMRKNMMTSTWTANFDAERVRNYPKIVDLPVPLRVAAHGFKLLRGGTHNYASWVQIPVQPGGLNPKADRANCPYTGMLCQRGWLAGRRYGLELL